MLQVPKINLRFPDVSLWLSRVKEFFKAEENSSIEMEEYTILQLTKKAKEEWQDAKRYFDEVTDPRLIDHAIYRIEAAEKKYIYLIKLSQKESLVNKDITLN